MIDEDKLKIAMEGLGASVRGDTEVLYLRTVFDAVKELQKELAATQADLYLAQKAQQLVHRRDDQIADLNKQLGEMRKKLAKTHGHMLNEVLDFCGVDPVYFAALKESLLKVDESLNEKKSTHAGAVCDALMKGMGHERVIKP